MASVSGVLEQIQHLVKHYSAKILVVPVVLNLLWDKFQPGLASIPGPTAAACTKLWRVYSVWRASAHLNAVDLHKRYGNLVRITPDHISVKSKA